MPLSLLAACLIATWAGLLAVGSLAHSGNAPFHLLYGAAAILFLLAVHRARRDDERALPLLLGAAVVCRLIALGMTPSLSDDWFRYVWEGQVQAAGVNPYALAPNHPALTELRDAVWLGVNHGQVGAIYGPLIEVCLLPLAALPGTLLPFKLFFVAADLGLAALVLRGLRRRALPVGLLVVYLWHPLPILEVAGQAHLEIVPIALLVLALELEASGRARGSALALGAAIAAKYLPVLLVPAFVRAAPPGRRLRRAALIALPVLVCTIPYAAAGADMIKGLVAYGQAWRFNDGGFWVVDQVLTQSGLSAAFCRNVLPVFVAIDPGYDPATHTTWMRIPAKLAVAGIVLVVTWRLSRPRADGQVDLERAALGAGLLFLAFSPTVHPWYGLWIVPFLPALVARSGGAPWLLLSLALPFAYRVKLLGWQEEPWVRGAIYLPVVALFLAGQTQRRCPFDDAPKVKRDPCDDAKPAS